MVEEDAGALADGGAGGDDVVEDADGEVFEGRALDGEGTGEAGCALGGGAADLATGVAGAVECDGGGREGGEAEEQLGLVEASVALARWVKGDGDPAIDREVGGGGREPLGEEWGEGSVALVFEAVDEGAGSAFVFVEGASAGEFVPVVAAGAEFGSTPAGGAVCAAPGADGWGEGGFAVGAERGVEGAAAGAAQGKYEVDGAAEDGSRVHGGMVAIGGNGRATMDVWGR